MGGLYGCVHETAEVNMLDVNSYNATRPVGQTRLYETSTNWDQIVHEGRVPCS